MSGPNAGKSFLIKIGDGGAGTNAAVKASVTIGDLKFEAAAAGAEGNEFSVRLVTGGVAGSESVHELDGAITIKIQSGVSTATQIKAAFDASDQAAELNCTIVGTGSNVQVIGSAQQLTGGADATSAEVFTTMGGLRSTKLTLNAQEIDTTTIDSGEWKEILDGSGIRHMAMSGSGLFADDAQFTRARSACMGNNLVNMKIYDGPGNIFAGKFKIKSVEQHGEYNGAVQYSMSLESSGAVTFTPHA